MFVALTIAASVGGAFFDAPQGTDSSSDAALSDPQLGLDFYPGDTSAPPSVVRLDERICIGSTCTTPTWRYSFDSDDATASAVAPWTYGDGLNLAGSGSAITAPAATDGWGSPLLGASTEDGGVICNAGKAYQATASLSGDLTTQDPVLTLLVQYVATAGVILEKRSGAGYTVDATTSVIRAILSDGTDSATVSTATLTAGHWYFLQLFADKSGSAQWYVNHQASGSAVSLTSVDSLTNSGKLTFCADSALANGYAGRIAYASLHTPTLPGYQNDTLALTRFYRLTRTLPSCRGNCLPLANTHDEGYLRKFVSASSKTVLFAMGAGWPRTEVNNISQGMLNERAPDNLIVQSEDLATTWTKLDAGDTFSLNSSTMALPVQSGTLSFDKGDGFIPDTSNGDHGVSGTAALTLTQDTSWSLFVKAGTHSWVYLSDDTASQSAYFDLTACAACTADGFTRCTAAVGTSTALGAYAKNYGNGVCRVDIQADGTIATHTYRWQVADANADKTITGDGASVALYVWGSQVSHYADYADLPIRTTTAAVQRTSGSLVFDTSNNIGATTDSLVCDWLRPGVADNASDYEYVLELSDGTTATFIGYGVSLIDTSRMDVTTSSVSQVAISDTGADFLAGQQVFTQAARVGANDFAVYLDSVSKGSDSSGTVPTVSQAVIGGGVYASGSTTGHVFYGHIKRCRIYTQKGRTS